MSDLVNIMHIFHVKWCVCGCFRAIKIFVHARARGRKKFFTRVAYLEVFKGDFFSSRCISPLSNYIKNIQAPQNTDSQPFKFSNSESGGARGCDFQNTTTTKTNGHF
jgi:hypothetical protein